MPRKPRFNLPGVPQHVIQRGNNREPCFYTEADYLRYLEELQQAAEHNHVAVHAWVLMTNHVHLLLTPAHEFGITHTMQDIGRKYVRYINRTYERSGTLWEGRFKAGLVDSEAYLLTCMRYIEMNPVRAGMVRHPEDYRWSSYRANAGLEHTTFLQQHPVYQQLGSTPGQQQRRYRELFASDLDTSELHRIRDALNQELVLGRDDFKARIEHMTQRRTRAGNRGRPGVKESGAVYYVL